MKKIGNLKKVDLRKVWENEAKDFTTWLSENIEVLGEALDLSLTEPETEKKLDNSSFHADIAAQTEDGEQVIIENQLEKTDHKHLGQILTYMVAMESKIAVWITQNPRPEHIKAIHWLNEETEKDFYLVKLEAYMIDDSSPAPYFSVICKPSKEMKEVGKKKQGMNEREKMKFNFWEVLLEKSQNKTNLFSAVRPCYWTRVECKTKVKDMRLFYGINANQNDIGFSITEDQKDYFIKIQSKLEDDLGFKLQLEKAGSNGGIGVSDRYKFKSISKDGGYRDKEKWNEIQDQMIDNIIKLNEVLKPYLSELNKMNENDFKKVS